MIYTKRTRVLWHDTDANRELTPSGYQKIMQETANDQLRDAKFDLDTVMRDRMRMGFLLSRIALRIYQPLHTGEEIESKTWAVEPHGLSFDRCFRLLRNGETVAEAYSAWGLMQIDERRLVRAGEVEYPLTPEEKILPSGVPLRFKVPPTDAMEYAGERKIVYSDVDYNRHMNNTNYPNMLCDFIPGILDESVVGFSLSYLREAVYGHTLRVWRAPYVGADGARGWLFRTADEAGETCLEALLLTERRKETI